jgi:hypothetical protein
VTERERVIRLNGIGGVRFQKTRIEFSIRVFLHEPSSSAERSEIEGYVLLSQHTATGFFDFARNDNVINTPTNLKIHAHH